MVKSIVVLLPLFIIFKLAYKTEKTSDTTLPSTKIDVTTFQHLARNMATPDEPIDTNHLIAEGAKLQLISDQFSFTEGPACDKHGNVYFTDQPNDKIWKYDTEGKLSLYLDKTGRANGLCFDRKGNLLACADEHNQLWKITPDKQVSVLLGSYNGLPLNGPNDLWVDKKDGIYFTDPYYQRPYWTRKKPEITGEKVYYFKKGKAVIAVDEDLKKPNGIAGSKNGKYLYVADIGDNKTYRYKIKRNGALTERTLFAKQGSDGMTIDDKGNVYLTGNGVTVYNAKGELITNIPVPAKWTANVCFSGSKKNKLFITASSSIYVLEMLVNGSE